MISGIVEGNGVLAVEDDGLLRPGGHELEVVHLVTVGLILEVKVRLLKVTEPHLPLIGQDVDSWGYGWLGSDTGGSSVHVAVNQD